MTDAVHRLATAQARIGRPPDDLPDRRPETLAAAVRDLLDGPVGTELSPAELRAAGRLQSRWEMLADCGLPDTVVHGDFHPGNWSRRRVAADAWIAAWTAAVPRSCPAQALRIAEPLAHLAYAVRYQEFLDNIEPSERVYHLGDPASAIRQAIACTPARDGFHEGGRAAWTSSAGC